MINWGIFGCIFGLVPYLSYKTIDSFNRTTHWRISISLLTVLFVGPTFGLFHQYREVQELKRNGVWAKAIVIAKKYDNRRTHHDWIIQCSFSANGKDYKTAYQTEYENNYTVGDTLDIVFSKDFPGIYRLGYQWKGK